MTLQFFGLIGFVNGSGLRFLRPQLVKGSYRDRGLDAHEHEISGREWKARR